jgi:hypothetical protein
MIRTGAFLSVFNLFLSIPVFAQEYTIQRAEYGAKENYVDVTARLRELAKRDIRFRLENRVFGVDPAKGKTKTLRIIARSPGGKERIFEYREYEMVDGSQFAGWREGRWGGSVNQGDRRDNARDQGSYRILRAEYGTRRKYVDVTARLRELAKRDIRFRLENEIFGVDPDRGKTKTLRIMARGRDGEERVFEYREYDTVDGSQFIGWREGRWGDSDNPSDRRDGSRDQGSYRILRAEYGTRDRQVDVTARLRELVRRDIRFRLENEVFGVDPDKGKTKILRIIARGRDGEERVFEYREYDTVDGSIFSDRRK